METGGRGPTYRVVMRSERAGEASLCEGPISFYEGRKDSAEGRYRPYEKRRAAI
jgi:hypothetical protein